MRAKPGEPMKFYKSALEYDGDDCLIWPYARTSFGYGKMGLNGKTVDIHRMICIELNGEPPEDDLYACHSCGNGNLGCVSKRHISWQSPSQNQFDRRRHGTHLFGERNPMAKLTKEDVINILSLRGNYTVAQIRDMYGLSRNYVYEIFSGKVWKDVLDGFSLKT